MIFTISETMATPRDKVMALNLSSDELNNYRRRFAALDLNKDGIVELREFVAVSKVFGYKLSKEEILVSLIFFNHFFSFLHFINYY